MGEASEVVIKLFGFLDVTGEVIAMWIILGIIAFLSLIVKSTLKEKPGKFQNIIEWFVEYLDNFFTDLLGKKKARQNFTFLASLFIFIIFGNYSGLIPGVGMTDYVKAPTASLSVTIALGVIVFVFLQASGLKHGVKHYFKRFVSPIFIMLPLFILNNLDFFINFLYCVGVRITKSIPGNSMRIFESCLGRPPFNPLFLKISLFNSLSIFKSSIYIYPCKL